MLVKSTSRFARQSWFVLSSSKLNFLPVFIIVFMLGYFQGLVELLIPLPVDLGILKYALLLSGGLLVFIRLMQSKRSLINRGIFHFTLFCMSFYILFFLMLIYSPSMGNDKFSLIKNAISIWGVLNIHLVFMVFADLRNIIQVYRFLRLLVWLGVFAAFIGIAQYLLGTDRLLVLGIDIYSMKFSVLNNEQSTVFRAFSVFPSHYEFASFMVVSILSKLILQLRSHRWPAIKSLLIFLILMGGLAVTFNVTLWLTLIGIVAIMLLAWKGKGLLRFLISKKAWRLSLTVSIFGALGIVFIPAFRERIIGVFNISGAVVGDTAGKSVYYRIILIRNILNLIKDYPQGMGPTIASRIAQHQNQHGGFLITSDSLFLWLTLMGGIMLMVNYIFLYAQPLLYSLKRRSQIPATDQPLFWGIISFLLMGVLLGGISNGAMLNGTPTNLLIWSSIGLLLRMVVGFKSVNISR